MLSRVEKEFKQKEKITLRPFRVMRIRKYRKIINPQSGMVSSKISSMSKFALAAYFIKFSAYGLLIDVIFYVCYEMSVLFRVITDLRTFLYYEQGKPLLCCRAPLNQRFLPFRCNTHILSNRSHTKHNKWILFPLRSMDLRYYIL